MKTFLGFDKEEWVNVRYIIFQNFVVSTFALMFLWNGWDTPVFKYVSLGSLLEFLLLFISVPLYLDYASRLYKEMESKKIQTLYVIFSLVMSMLIIGGTGIHFAANQIRTTVDTPMIEFYDEVLSHYMIWVGIIGLNSFFAFFQKLIPLKKILGNPEVLIIVSSGVIQGLVAALGILESRLGLPGILMSSVAFAVIALEMGKKQTRRYPLYIFYNVCLFTVVLCLALWYLRYGAFLEPSEVNFGRF